MLLLVAVMHPHQNEPVCGALVARMSFSAAMARIAVMQRRIRDGTVYNGPSPFVLAYLAQGARRALREAAPSEQGSLSRDLSAAIREVLPDPYALDDDGAPALASSADKNRNAPAFECGTLVHVRADPRLHGAVCRVSWNYRFHCWTYRIANDHGEVATRYKAEDLGCVPQPMTDAAQTGAGARLGPTAKPGVARRRGARSRSRPRK